MPKISERATAEQARLAEIAANLTDAEKIEIELKLKH
jgi:hypothetical protein